MPCHLVISTAPSFTVLSPLDAGPIGRTLWSWAFLTATLLWYDQETMHESSNIAQRAAVMSVSNDIVSHAGGSHGTAQNRLGSRSMLFSS